MLRPDLAELVTGVRAVVAANADWSHTAQLVADQLRLHLPSPDVLSTEQRLGSADGYRSHTLHAEADGSFSIIALVWRPGQVTRIHDHLTWCVFGVLQGIEHEELFDENLNLLGTSDNHAGDVNGFAPPRDIHRIHNTGAKIAISIHVYGTDVTRIGSSVAATTTRWSGVTRCSRRHDPWRLPWPGSPSAGIGRRDTDLPLRRDDGR
jgi:3-mercaptopropionate dioxygenase